MTKRSTAHGISQRIFVPGTFADFIAVPKRNAIVLPEGGGGGGGGGAVALTPRAWQPPLTAYRARSPSRIKPEKPCCAGCVWRHGPPRFFNSVKRRPQVLKFWGGQPQAAGRLCDEARRASHLRCERPLPCKVSRSLTTSVRARGHLLSSLSGGGTVVVTAEQRACMCVCRCFADDQAGEQKNRHRLRLDHGHASRHEEHDRLHLRLGIARDREGFLPYGTRRGSPSGRCGRARPTARRFHSKHRFRQPMSFSCANRILGTDRVESRARARTGIFRTDRCYGATA